jgi:hypothetical protein
MQTKHGDFWVHILTVINDAHDECVLMFMSGKPDEFEKMWLEPEGGRIARLSEHGWFADADPVPRRIASDGIRHVVQGLVEYSNWAKQAHDSAGHYPIDVVADVLGVGDVPITMLGELE